MDLAAVRLAESAAGAQRGRQSAPAAGELSGEPLHAALQLQRLESRPHHPHARRRAPARDAQESSRTQPQSRAEGAGPRPIRSAPRRARRDVLPHAEGRGQAVRHGAERGDGLRAFSRVLRGEPDRAGGHQLPLGPRERSARVAYDQPAHPWAARRAGHECEWHGGGQQLSARASACRWPDTQVVYHSGVPRSRAARARRRGAVRASPRQRAAGGAPAGCAGAAPSARHALVPPARPRVHARSGRQRPRRLPHRRRRCGRCDQSCDDGERASRSVRQDRAVRLPRAPHAHPAGRGVVGGRRCRTSARPGPRRAADGDQRGLHADGDVHASRRRRALAGAEWQRGRARVQVLHGPRRAVRVLRSPVVARPAWREARRPAPLRGRHAPGRGRRDRAAVSAVVRRHHPG